MEKTNETTRWQDIPFYSECPGLMARIDFASNQHVDPSPMLMAIRNEPNIRPVQAQYLLEAYRKAVGRPENLLATEESGKLKQRVAVLQPTIGNQKLRGFLPFDETRGLDISSSDYDVVHNQPYDFSDAVHEPLEGLAEGLYHRSNVYGDLKEFYGHTISMGDVIVFFNDQERTALYVDRAGFSRLPDDFMTRETQGMILCALDVMKERDAYSRISELAREVGYREFHSSINEIARFGYLREHPASLHADMTRNKDMEDSVYSKYCNIVADRAGQYAVSSATLLIKDLRDARYDCDQIVNRVVNDLLLEVGEHEVGEHYPLYRLYVDNADFKARLEDYAFVKAYLEPMNINPKSSISWYTINIDNGSIPSFYDNYASAINAYFEGVIAPGTPDFRALGYMGENGVGGIILQRDGTDRSMRDNLSIDLNDEKYWDVVAALDDVERRITNAERPHSEDIAHGSNGQVNPALNITDRQREQAERMAAKWEARASEFWQCEINGGDSGEWGHNTAGYCKTPEDAERAEETAKHIQEAIARLSYREGTQSDVQVILAAVAGRDALDTEIAMIRDADGGISAKADMPGRDEDGSDAKNGYVITHSADFTNGSGGYAIGHNPDAEYPHATWRFVWALKDDGSQSRCRTYSSGLMFKSPNDAVESFRSRINNAVECGLTIRGADETKPFPSILDNLGAKKAEAAAHQGAPVARATAEIS